MSPRVIFHGETNAVGVICWCASEKVVDSAKFPNGSIVDKVGVYGG